MHESIVFSRTRQGDRAINDRNIVLERKLRLALILVDGRSNLEALRRKALGFGDLEQALEQLALTGFIRADSEDWQAVCGELQEAGLQRARDLKARLIDAAIMVLGDDAGKVVSVLREAPDTESGLEDAVLRCKKIVDLTIDEHRAVELKQKCLRIISNI